MLRAVKRIAGQRGVSAEVIRESIRESIREAVAKERPRP